MDLKYCAIIYFNLVWLTWKDYTRLLSENILWKSEPLPEQLLLE